MNQDTPSGTRPATSGSYPNIHIILTPLIPYFKL